MMTMEKKTWKRGPNKLLVRHLNPGTLLHPHRWVTSNGTPVFGLIFQTTSALATALQLMSEAPWPPCSETRHRLELTRASLSHPATTQYIGILTTGRLHVSDINRQACRQHTGHVERLRAAGGDGMGERETDLGVIEFSFTQALC